MDHNPEPLAAAHPALPDEVAGPTPARTLPAGPVTEAGVPLVTMLLRGMMEVLRSYGWPRWQREWTRARRESDDVTDLLSPGTMFAARLRKGDLSALKWGHLLLLAMLAAPFALDIVVAAARGLLSESSPFYLLVAQDSLLISMYRNGPMMFAGVYLVIHALTAASPMHEHSRDLVALTHMRPLTLVYGYWVYAMANVLPMLAMVPPFLILRYMAWKTEVTMELTVYVLAVALVMFTCGSPVINLRQGSSEEKGPADAAPPQDGATHNKSKSTQFPVAPLIYAILFFNNSLTMFAGNLNSFVEQYHILPLTISLLLLLMPWIVMLRLLGAAEPWRNPTENFVLPQRLLIWGAVAGGALACVLCGWPAWVGMAPGAALAIRQYFNTPPPLESDICPPVHFVPFQGNGSLWMGLGRLANCGWESSVSYALLSFVLFAALGLAGDAINTQRAGPGNLTLWLAGGMYALQGVDVIIALLLAWNTLLFPLALMRLMLPNHAFTAAVCGRVHAFFAVLTVAIAFICFALEGPHVSRPQLPDWIQIYPPAGAFSWLLSNHPPDMNWLIAISIATTLLGALHLLGCQDWLRSMEKKAAEIRASCISDSS
ncbi:hypothetical protein DB346_06350 [Verrucomicrobia bacterium LW23]|nr:hypothetical protein DB346_06350 [Verrucomicrobia bacterium LW23]